MFHFITFSYLLFFFFLLFEAANSPLPHPPHDFISDLWNGQRWSGEILLWQGRDIHFPTFEMPDSQLIPLRYSLSVPLSSVFDWRSFTWDWNFRGLPHPPTLIIISIIVIIICRYFMRDKKRMLGGMGRLSDSFLSIIWRHFYVMKEKPTPPQVKGSCQLGNAWLARKRKFGGKHRMTSNEMWTSRKIGFSLVNFRNQIWKSLEFHLIASLSIKCKNVRLGIRNTIKIVMKMKMKMKMQERRKKKEEEGRRKN